jgi:hypothetical protein
MLRNVRKHIGDFDTGLPIGSESTAARQDRYLFERRELKLYVPKAVRDRLPI